MTKPPARKTYIYLGDRLTDPKYKGMTCSAVPRPDGKCIRGRNGTMLVRFDYEEVNVIARRLRKLKADWQAQPPPGQMMIPDMDGGRIIEVIMKCRTCSATQPVGRHEQIHSDRGMKQRGWQEIEKGVWLALIERHDGTCKPTKKLHDNSGKL